MRDVGQEQVEIERSDDDSTYIDSGMGLDEWGRPIEIYQSVE